MGIIELLLISLGLGIDAFSISVCLGLSQDKIKLSKCITISLVFALSQTIILSLGCFIGNKLTFFTTNFNRWISFIILYIIGFSMLNNSTKQKNPHLKNNILTVFFLSLASSIDALAIGLTLAFLSTSYLEAISLIGLTTLILSFLGILIGKKIGIKHESKAEFLGGIILILIGLELLIQNIL